MKKKEINLFEKAFGKAPKKVYKFTGLGFLFGYRSIVIRWSCQGIGFGELALIFDDKGLKVDSECMSDEFVISALKETIKRIKKGQKADKWVFSKKTRKGKCTESKENHELFISAVCLTFLNYIKTNRSILNIV